ncbi:restriction endonuclease subunit S [Vibrio parahaemolyticus]|uniref:restriction endonuclease subunit S n=1 Tax=Vibrio parahaemolyticus TaxID=670 RepID=UPI001123C43A|nr:restriction endonuclease subunit S [Vibrio parahaemolyticus]EKO3607029.1 restriction endonuclease subunit S [Vibrio metschnikovii]TOB04525.1 restriction endonuclease subunit S [Vibrio parahaemolyticus]HCG7364318.1 restriction endonuclease subunit S [Vibrio parahaemolyticus]
MVPNGWETHHLEDLATKISDGIHSTPKYAEKSPVFFVNGNNLKNGKIVIQKTTKHVDENDAKKHRKDLNDRTILMSINGTIGNLAYYGGENVVLGKSASYINVSPSANVDFIYYVLSSAKTQAFFTSELTGSTIKNLSLKTIKLTKIDTPPLPEQRKIAKILSTWDKAISTTEKLIETSKQQKKALMQQLLTGKKRLMNPETGKAFEGEWEEVKVAEFGKVVTGNTPPKNDDSNYGSDISWATAEDFKSKYVGNTKVKLTKLGASKARIVPKGSVLVTCIASIGKNAIAYENITTNQQINAVVINNNHCNEFFYYQIEFNKHKLLAWAGTTAVPILNKSSFEKIPLSAPSKNEQQKITSVLTAADKEIEVLEAKLAHFKQEKKALMQQLLTGKRRVKLDQEVAA